MERDAVSAGVSEIGGLFSTAEIKILICYIISSIDCPVPGKMLANNLHYEGIANCFEVNDSIDSLCKSGHLELVDKGEPVKVSWHSNCHALRIAKSVEASKSLLRKLSNVELIELEREEECCGFGGTFSIKEPEISNAMALAKIADIKKTGVKYLISGDGGCLLNINGTLRRNNEDIKCIHLYDFLLARLEGQSIDDKGVSDERK